MRRPMIIALAIGAALLAADPTEVQRYKTEFKNSQIGRAHV